MKVLFLVNSVFVPDDSRKTVTGYDYIVSEIAQKLSEKCEIDIYLLRPYPRSLKVNAVSIIGHSYKCLLKYFRSRDISTYLKIAKKDKHGVKSKLRNISYYLAIHDIEQLIEHKHYDIVHIHGVEFLDAVSSIAAAKCRIPFLFTMHGLISYGAPCINQIDMDSEQAVLNLVRDNNFVITSVSTGTKMIPCEDKGINPEKIFVINNAVKIDDTIVSTDWNEKYPLIKGKIVILSVGSVCERKNQIQLLRAINLLPVDIKARTMVFLAGQDLTGGAVEEYVKNNNLQDNVVICGFLSKVELAGLYKIANYNALFSLSEGFGLSLIEAAKYGIPTITFADLDAVKDVYCPESMMLINERSDKAVVDGLMNMFSKKWDKDNIIKSVNHFNENIYFKYLAVYNHIIDKKLNLVKPIVLYELLGL